MRLLHRLLRGPHDRRGQHLESCPDCRLQQRRERQYLERLRGADVPTASNDLTARLLARTEQLARQEPPAWHRPATVRGFRPALRAAALVAGGAATATVLLGGSAYLVGGDSGPAASGAPASVLLQRDLAVSGAAALGTGPGAGAPTGWGLTGEPDFTPAGALTDAQLDTLRSAGWACPELPELGYRLVWAQAGELAGGELLELRLTNGRNFVTVLEQHGDLYGQPGAPGAGGQTGPPVPVNVLTGRPATSDGFTVATVPEGAPAAAAAEGAGNGTLWIKPTSPFAAIYRAGDTTFTFLSDQPAEQASAGVAALVRSRSSAARAAGDGAAGGPGIPGGSADGGIPASGAGPDVVGRLERGLARIVELLAP